MTNKRERSRADAIEGRRLVPPAELSQPDLLRTEARDASGFPTAEFGFAMNGFQALRDLLQVLPDDLAAASVVLQQVAAKFEEAENKHADLEKLLSATDLPAVCLGTDLVVRWMTPAAQHMIRLKPGDRGRSLEDLAHDLHDASLVETAKRVLDKLIPIENGVDCYGGRTYLRRVTPYHTDDQRIGGVVITFIDISARKRSELDLPTAKEVSERVINSIREPMFVLTNTSQLCQYQANEEETIGRLLQRLAGGEWTFSRLGRRVMRLYGRRIVGLDLILAEIEDRTDKRQAEQRNDFLLQLTDAHLAAVDTTKLLAETTQRLSNFLGCQRAAYAEIDTEKGEVSILVQHAEGLREAERNLALGDFGPAGFVPLCQGDPLLVRDVLTEERYNEPRHRENFSHLNVRSVACIPQPREFGQISVLVAGRSEPHDWTSEEVSLIVEVANRTWSALASARAEARLVELNRSLEGQIADRTRVLNMLQFITRAANEARSVEDAMRAALARIADYNGWEIGHVWKPADSADQELKSSGIWYVTADFRPSAAYTDFQQACQRNKCTIGEGTVGGVLKTGKAIWVDDLQQFCDWKREPAAMLGLRSAIAFPVTVGGRVAAVIEFFSTRSVRREVRFIEIMPDVGIQLGHVIERKSLEREVADAMAEQQRYFGRELHDSVSQQLTGVSMLAETLRKGLAAANSPRAEEAAALVQHIQDAHAQVRRLSRGLMPVEVDSNGLAVALEDLADYVRNTHRIDCRMSSDSPIEVKDNDVATHLYRIAQEAIQNAIKHGQPEHIEIELCRQEGALLLAIHNDGRVVDNPQAHAGAGLKILRYRAGILGGTLEFDSRPESGTTVTCTVPLHF